MRGGHKETQLVLRARMMAINITQQRTYKERWAIEQF